MDSKSICEASNIHHTAIAVKDLDASIQFYATTFGAKPGPIEIIEDQEVRAVLLSIGKVSRRISIWKMRFRFGK